MSLPPRFLDEIRNRLSLSDIIGRRMKLQRAGREHKGLCPFHHETTPSFTVSDDKQFYHCFGCGAHGDVIKFVMDHDNMSFRDTIEMLASEAGLEVPKQDPQAIQKAQKAKSLHGMMAEATDFFMQELFKEENRSVQDYLQKRGITAQTVRNFMIGFAPYNLAALRAHLKKQDYTDQDMIEAGLTKRSSKGGDPYSFFRERVMFPVADRRGRIIAFGGRALPDHLQTPSQSSFKPPKYLNSSDTTLFDKGRVLYAEDKARLAARDGKTIIITEGYMDVIACHDAGFTGAVAPMGTAMTEDQIRSAWSMIPEDEKVPVLCFDGDNAGRQAAGRACERIMPLLKAGHSVRFAFLPDGQDPDSLIKSGGAAAFQKILDAALPLIDYIWVNKTAGRPLKTPEERAAVSKALRLSVNDIQDPDVQRHYKALIDKRIQDTFFGHYNKKGGRPQKPKLSAPMKPSAPTFQELYKKILLACMLNHPAIFDHVEEQFASLNFLSAAQKGTHVATTQALCNNPDLDSEELKRHLTDLGFEKEVRDICSDNIYIHAAFSAPTSDSQDVSQEEIISKWLEIWQSLQKKQSDQERKDGWKQALESNDEGVEQQLSAMVDRLKSG